MAINLTIFPKMQASIAELKTHLSRVISRVEQGETCVVLKHNKPVAELAPIKKKRVNRTKIGCARGTVKVHGDLTEPLIPLEDWEMLK